MSRLLAAGLALAFLSACKVGPDYQRPPISSPAQFRDEAAGGDVSSIADLPWWTVFRDPALDRLIGEAVQNNRDLRGAVARVAQARALARASKAELLPAITTNAGASYGRGSLAFPSTTPPPRGAIFEVDAQVSWEADVWGRIRRGNEAAVAQYLATEQGRRAALVALVSDVASAYVQLRQLDTQAEIARHTVANYQRTLEIYTDQLEGGAASRLPVATGQSQVHNAQGTARDLDRLIVRQENLLSLLLGRPPGPIARGDDPEGITPPATVPAGLPSTLLERRPDVLQAEQLLVAANAQVGVAKANFFPRFSLTGMLGLATPDLTKIFTGPSFVWSVGGGASWLAPILAGDALQAQALAASAQWEEAKNAYEQAVLIGFREVADALNDVARLREVQEEREAEVLALRTAVDLALDRFNGGVSSYLEVTTTQDRLFPAELNLAAVKAQRAVSYVSLYRALGGGWQLPDEPGPAPAPAAPAAPAPR